MSENLINFERIFLVIFLFLFDYALGCSFLSCGLKMPDLLATWTSGLPLLPSITSCSALTSSIPRLEVTLMCWKYILIIYQSGETVADILQRAVCKCGDFSDNNVKQNVPSPF